MSAWEATTVPTCRVKSRSVKTITPVLQAMPFTYPAVIERNSFILHNFDIRRDRNRVRRLKPLSCCQVPRCREEFFSVRDGRNTASDLQRKQGYATGKHHREGSVKSFDTSLLRGSSTRVETATKWENGRGKGNRKIAGAGKDGKGRRSARSAFFFPDQSRSLILAHLKFFSLYPLFMPSFLRSDF